MSLVYITEHFSWDEARCRDGTPIPTELQPNARCLADMLEIIRHEWGGPIIAVSWYRTTAYNQALRQAAIKAGRVPGTAKHSQHELAKAIDARPVSLASLSRFNDMIERMLKEGSLRSIGGIGYYPGLWVHLDIRNKPSSGRVTRWMGSGEASEMA